MGGDPGKLRAAAVWLLTPASETLGQPVDAEDLARLQALGVSAAELQEAKAAGAAGSAEVLLVWSLAWDAVRLFDAMRTQWRVVAGMGGLVYLGMDYGPLRGLLRPLGLWPRRDDPELLRQFQVMERAGRDELNKRASDSHG